MGAVALILGSMAEQALGCSPSLLWRACLQLVGQAFQVHIAAYKAQADEAHTRKLHCSSLILVCQSGQALSMELGAFCVVNSCQRLPHMLVLMLQAGLVSALNMPSSTGELA